MSATVIILPVTSRDQDRMVQASTRLTPGEFHLLEAFARRRALSNEHAMRHLIAVALELIATAERQKVPLVCSALGMQPAGREGGGASS
jgi:hypothetical protein